MTTDIYSGETGNLSVWIFLLDSSQAADVQIREDVNSECEPQRTRSCFKNYSTSGRQIHSKLEL